MAAKKTTSAIDLSQPVTCEAKGAQLIASLPDGNTVTVPLMLAARQMDTLVAEFDTLENAMTDGASPTRAWAAFKSVLPTDVWDALADIHFPWMLTIAKAWMEETFGALGKGLSTSE